MRRRSAQTSRIEREEAELRTVLEELPRNPLDWVSDLRIVGPIVARLAVRYALKRAKRGMSEDKVSRVADQVATLIRGATELR